MNTPIFNKDGYPTEETLSEIQNWEAFKEAGSLVEFLKEAWHWEHYFKFDGKMLELRTGGWSGNESIIAALRDNQMFWLLYWMRSERGGHYWFEIKTVAKAPIVNGTADEDLPPKEG